MDKVLMEMQVRASASLGEMQTWDINDALESLAFYMRQGDTGDWQMIPMPPAMLRPFIGLASFIASQSPEAFEPVTIPDSPEG